MFMIHKYDLSNVNRALKASGMTLDEAKSLMQQTNGEMAIRKSPGFGEKAVSTLKQILGQEGPVILRSVTQGRVTTEVLDKTSRTVLIKEDW